MQVFVYGTLKRGFYNHAPLLEDATFVGTATLGFKARMFCVGFPVLIEGETPVQVEGELFEVNRATFRRLDRCSVSPDSDNVIRWKGNGQ